MGIRLNESNVKDLKEINILMIGKFVSRDWINDNIIFLIKPICKEPAYIEENINFIFEEELYTGFDNTIKDRLPAEYRYENITRKSQIIDELFKDKVVVFKTIINLKDTGKEGVGNYKDYRVYKNMDIINLIEDKNIDCDDIVRIPVIGNKQQDFIKKITNKEPIELVEYPNILNPPEYIRCENYIYKFNPDSWSTYNNDKNLWRYDGNKDEIEVIDIGNIEGIEEFSIECSKYTYFLDNEFIVNMDEDDVIKLKDFKHIVQENTEKREIYNNTYDSEMNFIKGLDIYCSDRGLAYVYEDIINLHISIKTNMITIISGMTGTGKSQLALAYAKMLNASIQNENLLFIPISPNYMEPSDILGYYNQSLGMYNSSETMLVDFLVSAQKNIDKPHIIIFDEMNLSQVEHWFAPFLSLLELDEENRFINLYSKNNRCINDEKYPYRIKIGKNIRIIGTINLDETVKEFSDRLLDRVNVINLEKKSFKDSTKVKESYDMNESYEKYLCNSWDEYSSWITNIKNIDILKDYLDFFDSMHLLLNDVDPKKGISFRVIQSIAKYVSNIPFSEDGTETIPMSRAIDLEVKQRIISKLRGTNKTMGELLGYYDFESHEVNDSKLIDFLNSNKKISSFDESINLIEQKAKEISLYGYAY